MTSNNTGYDYNNCVSFGDDSGVIGDACSWVGF